MEAEGSTETLITIHQTITAVLAFNVGRTSNLFPPASDGVVILSLWK
jgi:hypothetical protein